MTLLLVALAGGLGAVARYLVDYSIASRGGQRFPWGIFTVNLSGSFLAGLVAGLVLHHTLPAETGSVLITGFLGAYTTFSSWMYESVRLVEQGVWRLAIGYLLATILTGPMAAGIALLLVSTI
jgi:fluoride exporter